MIIYSHKVIIKLQRINKYSENTGFMNLFANKGGIAIKLNIGQDTYLFISSHFASGQKSHQKRNENHKVIARSLILIFTIKQNITKQNLTPNRSINSLSSRQQIKLFYKYKIIIRNPFI
ncbi:Endonuclease/exonuclease/phosphatase [Pseudocohnilembus persalinus]|uniref:Endonuclease/exonuclease/phosphatase n=1 Tax=Pseudocohnilembus persalinus TaxID=266149 RepID=A0A0V0QG05_PSEPJ|nr:Endonuclease/exonuclease/phosphatase [Pseudocohnilembus persalinus]|eukprot:KRX01153.1 Endonuclease/exonuclease/phosphatase [Pseudocohnilembus persalinus]